MFSVPRLSGILLIIAGAASAQPVEYFRAHVTGNIVVGSDANLWFPVLDHDVPIPSSPGDALIYGIARMTPAGDMKAFPTPHPVSRIVAGSDGRVWFAGASMEAMAMNGAITAYPLPVVPVSGSLATASDGRIWFGYQGGVGAITTTGTVTLFSTASTNFVTQIVQGADGNIWFLENVGNSVGRLTPQGIVTRYPLTLGRPLSIALNNGTLWIAFAKAIARLSTDGTTSVYSIPLADLNRLHLVSNGPDALIWFSAAGDIRVPTYVGKIDLNGNPSLFGVLNSGGRRILGMTLGPDGRMWAALEAPDRFCITDAPCPIPPLPEGIARVDLSAVSILMFSERALVAFAVMLVLFGSIALRQR